MTEPRKCTVSGHFNGPRKGWFIGWGQGHWSDDSNQMHPRTFAIVEMEDGKVEEVNPGQVQFVQDERRPLVL